MAEALYPYSREEAKREGELDRWKESHRANVSCARNLSGLIDTCQRRCDFVVFRRTGYVEKWRVMVYSLCIIILAVFVRQA